MLNFTGILAEVYENTEVPAEVLVLNATDLDGDPNPIYTITEQSLADAFAIDGDKLVTNDTFDYESITNITVTIRLGLLFSNLQFY